MSNLLDQIIANTVDTNQNDPVILVKTAEELLAVAKRSEIKPGKNKQKSAKEQYYYGIFRELFKEAKFFYGQYKATHEIEFPKDEIEFIINRLDIILESINESFPVIEQYFIEALQTNDSQSVDLIRFVFNSLGTKDNHLRKN